MIHHRKQLRERVLLRQAELIASQEELDREAPQSARQMAVDQALAALDVYASGGWEEISEATAYELVRWLDQTEYLVVPGTTERAEMHLRRLETRVRLDEIGLPHPPQP